MNTILGWLANAAGLSKVWDFMDGKKTYAAAGLGILTSVAGLAVELAPILSAHNTPGLIGFIQHLPSDPSWLSLVAAFGLLGLGHSNKKIEAASQSGQPANPVQ